MQCTNRRTQQFPSYSTISPFLCARLRIKRYSTEHDPTPDMHVIPSGRHALNRGTPLSFSPVPSKGEFWGWGTPPGAFDAQAHRKQSPVPPAGCAFPAGRMFRVPFPTKVEFFKLSPSRKVVCGQPGSIVNSSSRRLLRPQPPRPPHLHFPGRLVL